MATLRRIADFKPTLTNLAQTSHFQVLFSGLPGTLRSYLASRGVDSRFINETAGLLCYSASLPGSSFATSDIVGNYMGIAEKMAHTRQFTQIDLEFYVDREYKTIKFLEHWMEFIASGSGAPQYSDGYYFRMQYPKSYKSDQTRILKFDRDYNAEIEYNFRGLFPYALGGISINYSNSDILKASATFSFERYIAGQTSSLSSYQGLDNNLQRLQSTLIDPFSSILDPIGSRNTALATGRDELINRNLNRGTGRLDDPRPVGASGMINVRNVRNTIGLGAGSGGAGSGSSGGGLSGGLVNSGGSINASSGTSGGNVIGTRII